MIITTTPSVEGRKITTYQGVVFGESITGINLVKDIAAGFRNILGGRSKGYEEELCKARQEALEEMEQRAQACLLYTSPSPRDISGSRMPSSA